MVQGIRRACRGRFWSADGQRADPHGDFVTPSPTSWSACAPGTVRAAGRAHRWPRTETWHPQPRRSVRRLLSHSARRRRRRVDGQGEHALATRCRSRQDHRPLRPVGRHRPGPHCSPEPSPRSRFPRFSRRPEPDGEPLPAVQNHVVPPFSICGRRRTGYGSIVTAWSRGTAISTGPGAAGMLWDGGRTTEQAGPV